MNSASWRAARPGPHGLDTGEQLSGEKLRKQDEIALVIGSRIEEELALLRKLVKTRNRPHLVLHHTDTNRLDHMVKSPLRTRDKIQVLPFEKCRVAS